MNFSVFIVLLAVAFVCAKDPAQGWLGYAVGTYPNGTRLTYIEAKWTVPENPKKSGAFFSPWFGIESSDNLNLIQPVNPWSGDGWSIYNEYYQWSPTYNFNSKAHNVKAGDVVFGSVTYVPENNTYTIYHSAPDGWSTSNSIPIQKKNGTPKIFNIIYFVFEKVWNCDQYPPNNEVTFFDIKVEFDNVQVYPQWKTAYVDDACNNRAHIVNDTTIQITWDTTL
eukprot:TRINITY_DN27463_c0_g1_i1.p1 TRINITY_DN27463_c0_g1~~TRINITY_DN27463_c0_g1_i1.p1  ORF type:complete len:223 (-),score=83.68 TRINITY_DN27463_c0_g1_i1:6-674(-)